ncbi:MAG TPA: DUF305 domain-containing protein [Rhizobiaceae bacterium]|nr:DUF305 domain-containing protein [Rhizobiaceae bacterium]
MTYRITAVATLAAATITAAATFAFAQLSDGSKALQAANSNMHSAMAIEMTGDVDVDFMRSMIPHHEGAVDMARIALQYGKDPEVRKLAEAVVAAQESEISFMNEWLKKKGVAAPDHSQH